MVTSTLAPASSLCVKLWPAGQFGPLCNYMWPATALLWSQGLPMCLRVISTVAFLLTLLSSPRQKRSELDGSVKPSTVRDG